MKFIKKGLNVLLILLSFFLALLVCLFVFLLIESPGKPEPFLNSEGEPLKGSISEKVFVDIGGVKQGMFIRGKNTENPVLLYVHGGPAFPNYFLIDKYKPGLEDYFTVCYWEQRGGGLSFGPEVTVQSMTFEQLAADAIEVTQYLRKRFGKDKIYIMAHSGGSPIALLAVARAPQLFHAYIAMAQITLQVESEKIAYKYFLEQYGALGNKKAVKDLLQYEVLQADANAVKFFKSALRDRSMHELGIGTMHKMGSVFRGVFIPVWTCRAYTFREKIAIWRSKISFLPKTGILDELCGTDFAARVPALEIPVYFMSGKYDLTVNIGLAKDYFKKLKAPLKGFYTFENSAHSPLLEEPGRFREILSKDVLRGKNDLADKP
jgi:pimeloyl-ACP methyl ester carboxylesterase